VLHESDSVSVMASLPDDPAALRELVNQLSSERDTAVEEVQRLTEQNEKLWHLLKRLQNAQFGKKSERLGRLDDDQLQLAIEDLETSAAKQEAEQEKQKTPEQVASGVEKRKRRTNRGSLPAHLPQIHQTLEPESKLCPCCQSPMHVIGEDISKRLDVIPVQYRILVTHRPKFGCRACESAVVQAPAPERLIKNGIPTEAMVAAVIDDKYAWHKPLYRQAQTIGAPGLPGGPLDPCRLGRHRRSRAQASL
jgi:transposase